MRQWAQNGDEVFVLDEQGALAARVCIASNMERAAEIVKLRQACSGGCCLRARAEFVRGALTALLALSTDAEASASVCQALNVTVEELEAFQ